MNILDIAIAKKLAGGGGGSGTDNYNDLSNLPKINDTTLSGNKSSSALGLQSEINSDSKLASDLVDDTNQDNKFVTSTEKNTWNAKQNAIDSDHKLSSDLVDDANHTNKFVTSTEKNTWNAKQNAIDSDHKLSSDLVDDANKTNKFVTSTEKNTWNAKQNAIDADHKLSSSLVSFTTAEAAALASGIDSSKVDQISTNQTNILSVQNKVGKNLLNFKAWSEAVPVYKGTKTVSDNAITLTATDNDCYTKYGTSEYPQDVRIKVNPGDVLTLSWNYSAGSSQSDDKVYIFGYNETEPPLSNANVSSQTGYLQYTVPANAKFCTFRLGVTTSGNTATYSNIMICDKAVYDQDSTFQPYGAPNYDLTYREQQDRNALAEVVDEGAKNVFDLYHDSYRYPNPITATGLTATIQPDGTVSVTGTPTTSEYTTLRLVDAPASYFRKFNGYYLSGSVAPSGTVLHTQIMFELASSPYTKYGKSEDGNPDVAPLDFPDSSSLVYFFIRIYNANTTTPVNLTFKPMMTTKAKLDVSQNYAPYALPNTDLTRMMTPFFTVPINHNMIYRGQNLGDTLTADQDTALSSGNFTDLYLGDYWTKSVTIPAFYEVTTAEPADWSTNYTSYYTKSGDTYTPVSGDTAPTWAANTYYERLVPAQTVTLKAVIADFDTFYGGYNSSYATINTHHAAVIVTGFNNVVWNKTNTTAGGYVNSLIHKWLVGSVLPEMETWFGSAKVLSHQTLLTNAITDDAASGWAWSSQKISLLSENQIYGSKVWGGKYDTGEAFKHLNVFNHIDANLLFGNRNIWLRDIASAVWSASLSSSGIASSAEASNSRVAPAALILLS